MKSEGAPQRHRGHGVPLRGICLSRRLSGQIKGLSPAIRDRIRLNRMMDRDKLIRQVIGAAKCRMAELFWPMVVSPSAKKESSLCALCASVVNVI
jgi:hypothetical protein